MKKALIVTDSLGLPRSEYTTEESWVYNFMLALKNEYGFYTYLKRAGTSYELNRTEIDFDHLLTDMIIMQLGICDCSRRPFPRRITSIKRIIINPSISKIVKDIINKYLYAFAYLFFDTRLFTFKIL